MKYSIITAFVLLALAQGSLSQQVVDLQYVDQFLEQMKTMVMARLQELMESPQGQDLAAQGQDLAEQAQMQMEPLFAQIAPMATNMQQIQPMLEDLQSQVMGILQTLMEQASLMVS